MPARTSVLSVLCVWCIRRDREGRRWWLGGEDGIKLVRQSGRTVALGGRKRAFT